MRLATGREAWPISRMIHSNHSVGSVKHIRPTTPKPKPTRKEIK
jgi:hypothetical protein